MVWNSARSSAFQAAYKIRKEKRKKLWKKNRKQRQIQKAAKYLNLVNNPNFYRCREWLELRHEALVKYGAICRACGAKPSDGIRLHVDHVKPRSTHPELALNIYNLQVLCDRCNLGKSVSDKDWR